MTQNGNFQKDIMLRLDRTSEVGRLITYLLDHPDEKVPWWDASEIGGKKRTPSLIQQLSEQFENLHVSYKRPEEYFEINYIPVAGKTVEIQSTNGNTELINTIQWPDAPFLEKPMSEFVYPDWYREMATMVTAGEHISLEGPPGVGKDTAVAQLAAECEIPLVEVSGNGLRRRDLVEIPKIRNGSSITAIAEFAAAAVNGWWSSITEINASDPYESPIMLLNSIVERPRVISIDGKTYPVHPDFRLFTSYNYGLIGTNPLPQSFKSRLHSIKVPQLEIRDIQKRLDKKNCEDSYEIARILKGLMNLLESGRISHYWTMRDAYRVCRLKENLHIETVEAFTKIALSIDDELDRQESLNLLKNL